MLAVSTIGLLALIALTAPIASAATSATASVNGTLTNNAGTNSAYTYTLRPSSGQISSFNLTAPTGWSFTSIGSFSPATGSVAIASGSTVIQGRGLAITASSGFSLTFTARAPCAGTDSGWKTDAKTGGSFTGSSFAVADVPAVITGECTASFDRQPADTAFNDPPALDGPSQNITSVPFSSSGDAIRVLVLDAAGLARPGVSITLSLSPNPSSLSGPITQTSDANGYATFIGSNANPISIDKLGLGYVMTPTGSGVTGTTQTVPFGVYQEGEPCASSDCTVHGRSADNRIQSTISAPGNGNLAVLVSDLSSEIDCSAVVEARDPSYEYVEVSSQVTSWKYTGTGSQLITVFLDKRLVRTVLDRGSDHLDFCFLIEGIDPDTNQPKTFVDKFGITTPGPSLLPDCNQSVAGKNCVVSQTATGGGGRLVTVTVEDGKGRI
jgi:hypothetical protein